MDGGHQLVVIVALSDWRPEEASSKPQVAYTLELLRT
jgi:hypothetical protein